MIILKMFRILALASAGMGISWEIANQDVLTGAFYFWVAICCNYSAMLAIEEIVDTWSNK